MYSINKYKLLRHTFVSDNHGSGFLKVIVFLFESDRP